MISLIAVTFEWLNHKRLENHYKRF